MSLDVSNIVTRSVSRQLRRAISNHDPAIVLELSCSVERLRKMAEMRVRDNLTWRAHESCEVMRTTVRYAGASVSEKVLKTQRLELNPNGGLYPTLRGKSMECNGRGTVLRLSFSAAMAAEDGERAK